jgi:hypothetical protein
MSYRSKSLFYVITKSWTFHYMNAGTQLAFSFVFLVCGIVSTYVGIHDMFMPSLLGGPFLSIIGIVVFIKARSKQLDSRNRKRKLRVQS